MIRRSRRKQQPEGAASLVAGGTLPCPATRANFSDLASRRDIVEHPDRFGFEGDRADDVWDNYVGKRVPERFLGSQNPLRYLKAGT